MGVARSHGIWTYRTGAGGSNLGRMFDKNNQLLLFNEETNNRYQFLHAWSGNAGANWTFDRPAANEWHHIVVTYDTGSTTNDPVVYVDGASVTVTERSGPIGTPTTNAAIYAIGNRDTDNLRNWAGRLAEFVVYDRILTATEAMHLYLGGPHRLGHQWATYIPMLGLEAEPEWSGQALVRPTVTGTVRAEHPLVLPPWLRSRHWKSLRKFSGR
jgi:hypothetical protein